MDARFRILEHPADVGIEAYGATLQELFENAAAGLISVIAETSTIQAGHRRNISIESTDVERLLVRWLNEILYLCDAERFLLAKVEIKQMTETSLHGFLFGEQYDPFKHELKMNVKAITYHQLNVNKADRWMAKVFLDV